MLKYVFATVTQDECIHIQCYVLIQKKYFFIVQALLNPQSLSSWSLSFFLQRQHRCLHIIVKWLKIIKGGGKTGLSWNVIINWYRWNFQTWFDMDLTSKNVLLERKISEATERIIYLSTPTYYGNIHSCSQTSKYINSQ